MEQVLDHINKTSDKIMGELTRTKINQWTAANIHLLKHVIDRLRLCADEFHFHLQKMNLKDEAQLILKLATNFVTVFEKVEEVNQRKVVNPVDLPIEYCLKPPGQLTTKTILGGAEVQPFSIYSQKQARYLAAEPEYKASAKQRQIRNMQSKGTDTNEDAFQMLNPQYMTEKEKELMRLEQENQINLMELEKHLKLKGLWSEMQPSHVQTKIHDLYRQMEKESYRNEIFVNDQLRIQNSQEEDEERKDMKKELGEKITLIQRKTAEKIMKAAEKKMKQSYERFVLKKTAGILMRKSRAQNYSRLDELEQLILNKNEEIFEKEQRINQLLTKFNLQEKRLNDLLHQIDDYKEQQEKQGDVQSHKHSENICDIEVQVALPDPRVFAMEAQLNEIMSENEGMRGELQQLHVLAKEEKERILNQPKQIEEILYMILQSDLSPEKKVEAAQTLLEYINEHSENDVSKMAANEIFKVVKSKVVLSSQRNQQEIVVDEASDEEPQQTLSITKKKRKNKDKGKKSQSEKPSESQMDFSSNVSESNTVQRKSKKKKAEEESSMDQDQSDYNNNRKKNLKNLYKISEESQIKNSPRYEIPKSSQQSSRQLGQKEGYLKVDNQSSTTLQPQHSQYQQQISSKSQGNINQPKEPSHFKTESRQPTSSGRMGPVSRQTLSRQETPVEQSVKITRKAESQRDIGGDENSVHPQQSSQNLQAQKRSPRQPSQQPSHRQQPLTPSPNRALDPNYNTLSKAIQVNLTEPSVPQHQHQSVPFNSPIQSQIKISPDQTVANTPLHRSKEVEKVTAKFTQTDDFFMMNLFEKMSADLGLTEEQLNRLKLIFLNEQQFIHFYEKDPSLQQALQSQSVSQISQPQNPTNQSTHVRRTSSLIMDKDGRFIELQRSESMKNSYQMQKTNSESDGVNQKRVSIAYQGKQRSQQPSPNGQKVLLSYTNETSIQNQHRSVSQNSDVHITNYIPVSPQSKHRRQTQSQRVLEEMLKNKSNLNSAEQEQREHRLYYNIFGEEIQNDADFELEAVRQNLGNPLEIVQDHMKEEAIKKIFTQMVTRPKNPWNEAIYMIISQFANKPPQAITYVDFKKYYENYMRIHKKCGESCVHIQRFLARIGFTIIPKRKQLNMSKQSVSPFGSLPKLK